MKQRSICGLICPLGLLLILFLNSCGITRLRSTIVRDQINKLEYIALDGRPMFGHQDDILYGYDFKSSEGTIDFSSSDVMSVCGDYPAILGLDLGRTEVSEKNLDNQYVDNIVRAAITHHERGGIITISWHADNPVTGKDAWDTSEPSTVYLILNDCNYRNIYINRLRKIASILNQIKDKDGNLIPIIFRPFHEMNHGFWWGIKNTSNADFISLWKLTYNFLVNDCKLSNLLWAYSPYSAKSYEVYNSTYPGDKYVDIICYERYQGHGQRELFISEMRSGLNIATDFAKTHKKLLAVSECGIKSVSEETWWTDTLIPAIQGFKVTYVLVWRNAGKSSEYYAPYKGHKSECDFLKLYKSNKFLFLNDINHN